MGDTLETWDMKIRRVALALKAEKPDPWTSSPKQRQRYRQLRHELTIVLDEVAE